MRTRAEERHKLETDASVVCSADTGCAGFKCGVVPHAHPNPHYRDQRMLAAGRATQGPNGRR